METINKCSFCENKSEWTLRKDGVYAFYCESCVPIGKVKKVLIKVFVPILIVAEIATGKRVL